MIRPAIILLALTLPVAAQVQIPTLSTPPKWSTGCDKGAKDQFGDSKRAYCWLFVDNLSTGAQIMDDNAFVIQHATLFEIDAKGLKLVGPKGTKGCVGKGSPKRIAVDGIRIDTLTLPKQIDAIARGKRLTMEYQGQFPYCGIAPQGTYLDGAAEAIEELKAAWASRDSEGPRLH